VAIPPVLPAGKEPRDFGLDRDKQLAVVRQLTEIIQLPPATRQSYRRVSLPVLGCAVVGVLVMAITSRSWWRLATPSLG
jgi:hypothetical protein